MNSNAESDTVTTTNSSAERDEFNARVALRPTIRRHLFRLLKISNASGLVAACPPLSYKEAWTCNPDKLAELCNTQNFRVDMKHSWKYSVFNRYARDVFCRDLLGAIVAGEYGLEPNVVAAVSYDMIGECLDMTITWCRWKYRTSVARRAEQT